MKDRTKAGHEYRLVTPEIHVIISLSVCDYSANRISRIQLHLNSAYY